MFETLFGSELPLAARFFIALLVVLALIGVTAWLVRRFGANRLGASARGRQPRLAVIDAATVDGRRRLVLIRRDNIEHLLMIGGPTDLVVEPNIVRAVGSREVAREPARLATNIETAPRSSADNRSPATEEPWHAPEPRARPRPADSLTGLAAELSTRLNPSEMAPPPPPRSEPAPRVSAPPPPPPPEPAAPVQSDHNLAEMAQQLEAALRRTPDARPPVTDPLATQARPADAPPRAPARDYKLRVDPRLEPKFDAKPEPGLDSPMPTPGKNLYENLEEEMASLLGRPPGKT